MPAKTYSVDAPLDADEMILVVITARETVTVLDRAAQRWPRYSDKRLTLQDTATLLRDYLNTIRTLSPSGFWALLELCEQAKKLAA
jgi:hypothetical protein